MTKIDIFSGFLGAGKTTLIKKLIEEAYKGEKLVLIENEFGEIGIDGGFLKEAGVEITEMNSGCICCSLVGDFGDALKKVLDDFHPDRVLIEPSGVGRLSDVLKAVQKVEGPDVVLNGRTVVADARRAKLFIKNFSEFYSDQIKTATSIILSRTGQTGEQETEDCVLCLREYNSTAPIITTPWDELTGEQILAAIEGTSSLSEELHHLEEEVHHHHHGEDCHCHEHHHEHHHDEECHCHEHEHHHDEECHCHEHEHHHDEDCHCHEHHEHHEHHHHHADEVFQSFGRETSKKFTEEEIKEALAKLDSGEYGTVLRAKGIVASEGEWIHFDYVPNEVNIRRGGADIIGKLCVIGAGINEEKIAELFEI